MKRDLKFYRTESGHSPVEDFLDSLNAKQAQKVVWVLRLFQDLDTVPSKYFKRLVHTDELWEIRVDFASDTFRLLSFFDGKKLLILAHGFPKKKQKVPKQMIDLAKQRKKDYFRRNNHE